MDVSKGEDVAKGVDGLSEKVLLELCSGMIDVTLSVVV